VRLVRILVLVSSLITGLLLPTMSAYADDPLPVDATEQPTDPPTTPPTDPALPPTDPLPVPPPPPDVPDIPDDPGWGV